ncbi:MULTISPECIES: DUF1822 family protein [Cyanophyceae]|uniref:DUF1822 family protein n=1 Tax=Cyanophyceae TaxID=3028117 RepID=UPI00232F0434|nr:MULTISPECIES: DUF1822 family protein [Cyanophyceae]MDB9357795.1 DUF1822 family protein [Nodularia spumigena CS-587/03]MDB9306616.1 DUF1822 family protein [Nodularia spumigena CS-591/12]MDB9316395.1 DUF1822 family protein [Nodularia spumigena CS-590/01A]MDB9321194.1 DUF1822 family protein [Nodularia spumigena CS-591/07A]MDB9327219.1 DUF1822 family protein [Nodularia spumigena CS-590/02]
MNSITEQLTFSTPLTREAHTIAQQCSQGISNPIKRQQIYLNTLAVYAVDNYLQCMGFATNWPASDSRNQLAIKLMNVADLEMKNLGKLECRPVLHPAEKCEIPPEVMSDRIGYVAVQLNTSLNTATILGFTPQPLAEIPLNQLQTLSEFLLYLSQIEIANSPETAHSSNLVKIGQWLDGIIDAGWQSIEQILTPQQLGLAFKSAVSMTRAQKIDLGIETNKIPLALVMKVTTAHTGEIDILTQVYPVQKNVLPAGVKLSISDQTGATVLQVASRTEDNWIQLEFSAEIGEKFQIIVAYSQLQQTREFEI